MLNSGSPSSVNKTAVKWLFAAVLAAQPLQYAIAYRYGEPYPALMMPRFTGTLTDAGGLIRIQNVEAQVEFQDHSVAQVSPADLVAAAPVSQRDSILYENFGPLPDGAALPRSAGLAGRVKDSLLPGLAIRKAKSGHHIPDSRTREWLKQRLQAIYRSRVPAKITFVWFNEVHQADAPRSELSREPIGTYQVVLNESR